jgi:hypothetical protein
MKKLITLIGIITLIGCGSSQNITEDNLVKTKIYVGKYENSYQVDNNFTFVMTTKGLFKLKHNPNIPDSSSCYVRLEYPSYDFHPDIRDQMTAKYISWSEGEKEYMIYNQINIK